MKQRIVFAFVVFVLGLVGITTSAQTPTGSVQSIPTDPGKAALPLPVKRVSFDMKMPLSTE
jgi:hypothetical protein